MFGEVVEKFNGFRIIVHQFGVLFQEIGEHAQNRSLMFNPVGKLMFVVVNFAIHFRIAQVRCRVETYSERQRHCDD